MSSKRVLGSLWRHCGGQDGIPSDRDTVFRASENPFSLFYHKRSRIARSLTAIYKDYARISPKQRLPFFPFPEILKLFWHVIFCGIGAVCQKGFKNTSQKTARPALLCRNLPAFAVRKSLFKKSVGGKNCDGFTGMPWGKRLPHIYEWVLAVPLSGGFYGTAAQTAKSLLQTWGFRFIVRVVD